MQVRHFAIATRQFGLQYVAAAASLAFGMPAASQTSAPDAPSPPSPPSKLERVEITGSSIKRIEGETALPVQVLNRDDIQRTGAATVEQLLKSVSATSTLGSTSVANTGAGGGQGGSSSVSLISLRGLGSARTLVLVNGRRVAPAAGSSAVDISAIPIAAIDRVEVLKDGASAVYGSDAVAGVVNFILRRDIKRTEVSTTVGVPTRDGGGTEARASILTGFGDFDRDRYSMTIGVSYASIHPIFGSSRSFAHNIDVDNQLDKSSTTSFPANVLLPSGKLASPNYPSCGPYSLVSPLSPGLCRYDNAPYISIQPESRLANLTANVRFNVSDVTEGYVETFFSRNTTTNTQQHVLVNGAALPAGSPYTASLTNLLATQYPQFPALKKYIGSAYALLPPTSPYYPTAFASANGLTGQPLVLLFRSIPTGTRITEDVEDAGRVVGGVRGSAYGWDYDAAVLYSRNKIATSLEQGWALTNDYLNLVNTGVINPFGPTADQTAANAAMNDNYNGIYNTTTASIASVDAKASRELYKLPAGMLSLAIGAEFRQEKLDISPSAANQRFLVLGFGAAGVPLSAQRKVASTYAEVNVPIIKGLEADAAVRYDKYQNVGSTVNPKGSLRWQPVDAVLLRASLGTGFRAPTLVDQYSPPARGITTNGSRDLVRCPPGTTGLVDCSTQFVTIGGGNPGLSPEKSKSATWGILLEPTKNVSVGVDYFRTEVKDIIRTGLSAATILGNPATYTSYIRRGPPDGNPSGVGPIIGIDQSLTNLGKTVVAGIDVDLKGRVQVTPQDRVTGRLNGTYLTKYDQQNLDGSFTSALDNPAAIGIGVAIRWRHTASVSWENGPWAATLVQNFQGGYRDLRTSLQAATVTPREVGTYETYDLQATYWHQVDSAHAGRQEHPEPRPAVHQLRGRLRWQL